MSTVCTAVPPGRTPVAGRFAIRDGEFTGEDVRARIFAAMRLGVLVAILGEVPLRDNACAPREKRAVREQSQTTSTQQPATFRASRKITPTG